MKNELIKGNLEGNATRETERAEDEYGAEGIQKQLNGVLVKMANDEKKLAEEKLNQISQDDFESYEEVRDSGVTNMCMIGVVSGMTCLSREKVLFIMKNYEELMEKYPGVRC